MGLFQLIATWSFLDRMALCFGILMLVLTIMTLLRPLAQPVELPVNPKMDVTSSKTAKMFGYLVVALTLILYAIFW